MLDDRVQRRARSTGTSVLPKSKVIAAIAGERRRHVATLDGQIA